MNTDKKTQERVISLLRKINDLKSSNSDIFQLILDLLNNQLVEYILYLTTGKITTGLNNRLFTRYNQLKQSLVYFSDKTLIYQFNLLIDYLLAILIAVEPETYELNDKEKKYTISNTQRQYNNPFSKGDYFVFMATKYKVISDDILEGVLRVVVCDDYLVPTKKEVIVFTDSTIIRQIRSTCHMIFLTENYSNGKTIAELEVINENQSMTIDDTQAVIESNYELTRRLINLHLATYTVTDFAFSIVPFSTNLRLSFPTLTSFEHSSFTLSNHVYYYRRTIFLNDQFYFIYTDGSLNEQIITFRNILENLSERNFSSLIDSFCRQNIINITSGLIAI